ncbi:MAG: GHMP kinase [Sulfolobaceae archaeon]|nr:GHMP kinase [Sulfolobaceae archaeon]
MKLSAPGKVLWVGRYSVVFGGISHVIAVDKRATCEIEDANERIFETSVGVFKGKGNELIESVIKVLEEKFGDLGNFKVKLYNQEGFYIDGKKTGLGSSSASTVALTACLYARLNGGKINKDEIYKLAQKANYIRQKGIGSGFDIAAAVFGSIIYRRFNDIEKVDSYQESLEIPSKYEMILGYTGRSSSTVDLVKRFVDRSNDPRFKEYMELIERENQMVIKYLKMGDLDNLIPHLELANRLLNSLSKEIVGVEIESERDRKLIGIAVENGAAVALSPGAGGGDSLFVLGEDLSEVRKKWSELGLKIIPIKQDSGLRVEDDA